MQLLGEKHAYLCNFFIMKSHCWPSTPFTAIQQLSPVFYRFHLACSMRCSFLPKCLLYHTTRFNKQFLKTNTKFYRASLLHFTCHARGHTNSLYRARCNSRLERQNTMKFCTHSYQTSYSVILWLFARCRYLYYLQTFSSGTFQTYCVKCHHFAKNLIYLLCW